MPSNIRSLKQKINVTIKTKSLEKSAEIQRVVTTIYLEELARLTPVLTGRLAGGYVVVTGSGRPARTNKLNKTGQPSLENIKKASTLKGNTSVSVINNVRYANFVDKGAQGRPGRYFFRRARLATNQRLQALGLRRGLS